MTNIDWQQLLRSAVEDRRLIQLVLSRPLQLSAVSKVSVRPVTIGGDLLFQWTTRRGPQEFHENLSGADLIERVGSAFGGKFGDLHWFADDGDFTVRSKPGGRWQVKRKPASKSRSEDAHNRSRQYLIPDGEPCPFLQAVGVMTPDGQVKPSKFHKFRQINRYLEFIDDIYDDLPSNGPIHVVDFGCGKSYLTFAVHHYLTVLRQRSVQMVGLDRNSDVVQQCDAVARELRLAGLRFETGEIHTFAAPDRVHLAISLHACDTATDDALASALRWRCDVIMAVPCCQHELHRLLPETTLAGLTGYGLLKERFAAMATDALRARFLEMQGYRMQVVEFIDMEHTPKNVLLRGVRRPSPSPEDGERRRHEYDQYKRELGISTWHLEQVAEV